MPNSFKSDPVIRAIVSIILITLAIGLIFYLFGRPTGYGMNVYGAMGGSGEMGGYGGMMQGYGGINLGGLNFGNIIGTLFQILLALSVLGLLVGLVVYLYQLIVRSHAANDAGAAASVTCAKCGAKVSGDAHFCPACGTKVN